MGWLVSVCCCVYRRRREPRESATRRTRGTPARRVHGVVGRGRVRPPWVRGGASLVPPSEAAARAAVSRPALPWAEAPHSKAGELPAKRGGCTLTAAGGRLWLLGGAELSVDGQTREPRDVLVYKGVMLRDVPNMAMVFGYTNASWTLKADIAAEYVCRLLNYMSRKGLQQVTPKDHDGSDTDKTFLDLQSGYVQRAAHRLPRQGDKAPWKVLSNYLYDLPRLRYGRLNDDALEFVKAEGGKRRRLGVSRG